VSEALTTSPLLFGYPGRDGRLAFCDARVGTRFRLTNERAAEIVASFLEPRSIDEAERDGFSEAELREARDAGLLVSEPERDRLELWEESGWSRPAFLMFSQMDIPYREFEGNGAPPAQRREALEEYSGAEGYPQPKPLVGGEPLELPEPPARGPALSAMTSRRSVRAFSSTPPAAEQLAGVLRFATDGFRTVGGDRACGEQLTILNSFYSWAHPFVVVQDVAGIPRGVYEFDWMRHRLLRVSDGFDDDLLLGTLQGQRWVLGTGFAVFVVADLRGYAWIYRHSRAYLHVLMQVGELGQELLMAAGELGLGGWTSPALHESRAAALLGLPDDDAVDALSVVKLGRPR
jgi:SagB-type dehydrogenase family enzyme